MKKKGTWGGKRPGSGRPPKHGEPTKVTAFTLPPDLLKALAERAEQKGLSRSELVADYLKRALAKWK